MSSVRARASSTIAPLLFGAGAILALATGFSAVSDDDFARVTIAQTFAHAPRLDPSGSSWLPFPFWWLGTVMAVAGRSLLVARVCAVLAAMLGAWLVDRSCRLLGASLAERALAAFLLLALPTTPFLAAATVPEVLTAGLACYGVTALASGEARDAALGGAALVLATLSRYETWPMAFVAGAFAASRARGDRTRIVPAVLAFAGPLLWLGHCRYAHGDALWALRRVAAFRAHAGGGPGVLSGYPLALARDGVVLVGAALVAARARGAWLASGALPVALAAAASFCFLLLGDVLGGAPTHHPERALLPAFCALVVATLPASGLERRAREGLALAAIAGVLWVIRAPAIRASFVDRRAAIEEGHALAALVPVGARVVVARDTYATEATRAAFVRAEDLFPLVSHGFDARSVDEPFVSADSLRAAVRKRGARYLVVGPEHAGLATPLGPTRALLPAGLLVELADAP